MAAALPRNSAGPSRPESRRPSRAPLSASIPNARETASSDASSTVIQNSPGATRRRTPRSGSSANANRSRTISPNGAICCIVTRERASMRRSLPATSRTSCQRFTWITRSVVAAGDTPAAASPSLASSLRSGFARRVRARLRWLPRSGTPGSVAWPAVRTTSRSASARTRSSSCDAMSTVLPSVGRGAHDLVEHGATLGVEPGVRLVEEQEPGIARPRHRQREATPLPGRQAPVHDVASADRARRARVRRPRSTCRGPRPAPRTAGSPGRSDRRNRTSRGPRARGRGARRADRARGRGRGRPLRPSTTGSAPRAAAATWSCPRHWRPRGARSRPRRRRDRPRPRQESDRAGRRRSGDGRRSAHSPPGDG